MSIGDLLQLASLEEPGGKLEWQLTLKIPAQNSGMATVVSRMLSSMNFEESSTLRFSSSGVTVIQSSWKTKDPLHVCKPRQSGSLPTYTQETGILK